MNRTAGTLAASAAAIVGMAAFDVLRRRAAKSRVPARLRGLGTSKVKKSVAVNRSPEELYRFWHEPENLPRFMQKLEGVQRLDERRFRWDLRAADKAMAWDVELIDDVPGERIAWRTTSSEEGLNGEGSVRFEPLGRGKGTRVTLDGSFALGRAQGRTPAASLFLRESAHRAAEDLRRFKQLVETGEVATTDGQPTGRRSVLSRALP